LTTAFENRNVIFIDDNGTDWATYMHARKLVIEAGASDAAIVVLTRTLRTAADRDRAFG